VSGRARRYMIYSQGWRFFPPLIKEKHMLPTRYLPTTLFCISVDRFGLAEALHYFADIIEIGGK